MNTKIADVENMLVLDQYSKCLTFLVSALEMSLCVRSCKPLYIYSECWILMSLRVNYSGSVSVSDYLLPADSLVPASEHWVMLSVKKGCLCFCVLFMCLYMCVCR